MVINAFTYNGEDEILAFHLDMMYPYVDRFIIVEAPETFNGTPKPLYYKDTKDKFNKWADKITYYEITKEEDYPNNKELLALADSSPNVPKGMEHWRREFYKKELIKNALIGLDDEDVCIIGDVDEILDEHLVKNFNSDEVLKVLVYVYSYYLNNLSTEHFYGPIISKYKNIKDGVLNHLRQFEHVKSIGYGGWHFTNCDGYDGIIKKVTSSYDEFEHAGYTSFLKERMGLDEDYLGREFTFTVDESNWPQYLKDNKEKYSHLCK